MVLYTIYFICRAIAHYLRDGNSDVFFFHNLVTLDLSAIYMACFASFALFHFVAEKKKGLLEKGSIALLITFVILLSSKSIIFIDVLLIICYYIYFSKTPKSVKALTIVVSSLFLIFSIVYIKQVRERVLLEYETAFVDNTISKDAGNARYKMYNISLHQAWNEDKFQNNNYLPGTALRIFQIRIFKEMLYEQDIFFTGFGLSASQDQIRNKVKEHNLYPGNGEFNFHNQYVQTFAELGVFAFAILLLMMFLNIRNAFLKKDFIHIVFAFTMIMLFLTDSFLTRQRGIIFFLTLYCLFNTLNGSKRLYILNNKI
ncbi:MAG: hypothetical protein CFE23_04295 [Flavobacterium sp. BFFFF1]|nr:MAG: hypothetical protein CFE23_04295 [Flavobacterium sp. BFFFF1]